MSFSRSTTPITEDRRSRETPHGTLPLVPAAFFGMALGILGLGGTWRVAHRVWGLPANVGESLMLLGTLVWATLIVLFAMKWVLEREEARREAGDPIHC